MGAIPSGTLIGVMTRQPQYSTGAKSTAGPFEDARAAYELNDYATALLLLKPLADEGHVEAQKLLGYMVAAVASAKLQASVIAARRKFGIGILPG